MNEVGVGLGPHKRSTVACGVAAKDPVPEQAH